MRIVHFVQDLFLFIFIATFAVLVFAAVNPPETADQQRCEELYSEGLDYAICVIDKTI